MKRFLLWVCASSFTTVAWAGSLTISAPAASTPGGTNTQIQYNNNTALGGAPNTAVSGSSITIGESVGIGSQSSTGTVTGNLSLLGGIYLSSFTSNGTAGIVTSNYTTGCTDSVIFASAPAAGLTVTLEAANKCATGLTSNHVLQITKVNASTYPVTILATSPNLIEGTTGLLTLNAIGQTDELVTDAVTNWWPHGQGIQVTPAWLSTINPSVTGSFTETTSSDIVNCPVTTQVPVTVIGFQYMSGGGGGQIAFGILDGKGNVLASTGPVTIAANAPVPTQLRMNQLNIPPGQYFIATQISNTVSSITGQSTTTQQLCGRTAENAMGIVSVTAPTTNSVAKNPDTVIILGGGQQGQ